MCLYFFLPCCADIGSYDYPVYDTRSIHPGDDEMPETFADIRRLNPDFEEPNAEQSPPGSSSMTAMFHALNSAPPSASGGSSAAGHKYFEPLGASPLRGRVRTGRRVSKGQKSAREYQDYHGDYGYHQQQVKVKKVVKKVYVPVPVIPKKKKSQCTIIIIFYSFSLVGAPKYVGSSCYVVPFGL